MQHTFAMFPCDVASWFPSLPCVLFIALILFPILIPPPLVFLLVEEPVAGPPEGKPTHLATVFLVQALGVLPGVLDEGLCQVEAPVTDMTLVFLLHGDPVAERLSLHNTHNLSHGPCKCFSTRYYCLFTVSCSWK